MTRSRLRVILGALVCALVFSTFATFATLATGQTAKGEHAFKGVVQKIDEKAKSLTVDGENVPGWMMAMTMSYTADKEEVFKTVKAGDQITATVKDGDFKTLYNVKVVPKDAPKK
jgi:Cu/Ag efflux protein CusF